MVNNTLVATVNCETSKMPTTTGFRKVRCPNCTALLTEPSIPIYECPICLTLLSAKGSGGGSNGRPTENHLQRTVGDAESFQQTPHGASNLENDGGSRFPGGNNDNAVFTHPRDDEADDMPLYRKRYPRPRTTRTEAFLPKFDPSSSDMPLYTPSRRRTSYSPNRSGYSSDKSERGRYFSGLESASHDESETDFDFPSPLPENIHAADQQETTPSLGQTQRFHLAENSDKGEVPATSDKIQGRNIDLDLKDNGGTQQEVISHSEGDQSELFSQEEETGKEASDTTRRVDLDCGTVKNEKGGEAIASSEVHLGYSLIEAAGSKNIATSQSSLTEAGISALSEGESGGTDPEARHGNRMTWGFSECREDVHEAVSVDQEGNGNDRNQGSARHPSTSSRPARGRNLEANLGYMDDCSEKLVKMEGPDSLEISFCGWQSLKDRKHDLEDCMDKSADADLVDKKSELKSDMATIGVLSRDGDDVTFSTLQQQEDPTQKHFLPMEEGIWSIQKRALSSLNNADLSTATLFTERGDHNEKSTILSMRTEVQVRDEVIESQVGMHEASYVTEYEHRNPSSSAVKTDQLNMGRVATGNQEMNQEIKASNIHLQSASKMVDLDKKHEVSNWTEKAVAGSHLHVKGDLHVKKNIDLDQKRDSNGSIQQGTALSERLTLLNRTANGTRVPDHLSRSYHHLDTRIAPSERWPMNDNNEKVSDTYMPKNPTRRHSLDLQMVGLTRNMNGLLEDWQGHEAFLHSRKFQANRDVMDRGSTCLLHDPAANFHGHSARMSGESRPYLHLNEQYLSNSFGMSQSTATSRASPLEVPSRGVILSGPIQEHAFNHCAYHSVSPVCTFCIQRSHPQIVQNVTRHHCAVCFPLSSSMAHQPVLCKCQDSSWAPHTWSSSYAKSSVELCQQTDNCPPQGERHKRSISSLASLARKPKNYPPLPWLGAPPYVLCQACHLLLEVPTYVPRTGSNVQKLRCSACKKISKFSIHQQANSYSKSSRSSRIASEIDSMARVTSKPHPIQSSTASKVHPELSTALPSGPGPLFPANDHGKQILASKVNQSVEPSNPGVVRQMTGFSTGRYPQYEQGGSVLPQPYASKRTITALHHPRPVTANVQGQGLLGDNYLNNDGTYGESYRLPLPPSAFGDASDHPVLERQKNEALGSGRFVFEGRKTSTGVPLHSPTDEGNHEAFLAPSFGKDLIERRTKLSPVNMQNSHDGCHWENSGNDPFGRHQMTCQQQHIEESDYSRSSSASSTDQLRKGSVAPGAPLIEHLNQETAHFAPSLQQSNALPDSSDDGRSAPWSGPPLHSYLTSDDDTYYQDKVDAGKFPGPSGQDVSRRPNYVAGLLKNSLREFGKGWQGNNNRQKVMLNGQLIPDAVVSKAEERAGRIGPGSYWYDYQAGFWGVMGGPCLGIIPPFIKELNFPMAKDCAGGNTGILVNGRELHEKDLQVLTGRGLPTTPGKAYIIDFSGRVYDRASGQRLGSLGKLAPSVEIAGCGRGMFQA